MRWLRPAAYPTPVLLLFLAILSVALAWVTFDLARLAMANVDFLRREGLMAIAYGGLWQTLGIAAKGVLALFLYLGFKGTEREIVTRWVGGD
jgi:hypothetical protein